MSDVNNLDQNTAANTTVPTAQEQQARPTGNGVRVRMNFYQQFASISRTSMVAILVQSAFVLAEIATGIAMLAVGYSRAESCDGPLDVYIIMYCVLLLMRLPLTIYMRVMPPIAAGRRNSSISQGSVDSSGSRRSTGGSQQEMRANAAVSNHQSQQQQQDGRIQQLRRLSAAEQLKRSLEFCSTMTFLFGNWIVFSHTRTCAVTAPYHFYTALSFVIMGYMVLLLPLLLILAIIFCLPLVLIFLRLTFLWTGVNLVAGLGAYPSARVNGTTEEVLKKIPVEKYGGGVKNEIAAEDAHCTICLVDYTDGDDLKRLPGCRHHYHAACIDSWLVLNKTCPYCREDVELEVGKATTAAGSSAVPQQQGNQSGNDASNAV